MTHSINTPFPNRLTLRSDGELEMIDGSSVEEYLKGVLKAHGLENLPRMSVVLAPRDGLEQWRECLVKSNNFASRIRDYLGNGGLFNPEHMEHDKVRKLLMDMLDWASLA